MAQTDIFKYSTNERLGKMDVDFIDVTVEPDVDNAGAGAVGDLLFKVTEIEKFFISSKSSFIN